MLHASIAARLAIAIALLAPPLAAAPPTTQTQPATQSAGTPQASLEQLNIAMRDGDRQRIVSLLYTQNAQEAAMVDAMASMAEALAKLHKSAVKAFGAKGAKDVTGDNDARWAEGIARIQSADVKIAGDTATVVYRAKNAPAPNTTVTSAGPTTAESTSGDKTEPVKMVRVNSEWKLPVAQLATGADAAALKQRLTELSVQTTLVKEIADEIAAAKYDTAEQAADAWHSRFMQSLGPKPATQPIK